VQKSKMSHIDVIRNENGITMTIDDECLLMLELTIFAGIFSSCQLSTDITGQNQHRTVLMKTVFQTIYDEHKFFNTSLVCKTVVT
jgi:hypothetical protein